MDSFMNDKIYSHTFVSFQTKYYWYNLSDGESFRAQSLYGRRAPTAADHLFRYDLHRIKHLHMLQIGEYAIRRRRRKSFKTVFALQMIK